MTFLKFNIRRFDIYRKVPKDLTQPTRTGAVISLATIAFCFYLLLAEFSSYIVPDIVSEVYVDDPVKSFEDIPVFLNISLLKLPCSRVGLDVQDDTGRHDVGLVLNSLKRDLPGGEGCLFQTSFRMAKVSGNFHVSTHAADAALAEPPPANLAHEIHELSFGTGATAELQHAFKEVSSFAPLDGRSVPRSADWESHDYFLKVVPSIFDTSHYRLFPFQFTALYRKLPRDLAADLPAIWFRCEIAPIVVKYKEHEKPFYHFLTQACAIIGGSFTVAGILDSLIFSTSQIFQKAQLGKLP